MSGDDSKADWRISQLEERVKAQDERIDALEADRDRDQGARRVLTVIAGAVVGSLVYLAQRFLDLVSINTSGPGS